MAGQFPSTFARVVAKYEVVGGLGPGSVVVVVEFANENAHLPASATAVVYAQTVEKVLALNANAPPTITNAVTAVNMIFTLFIISVLFNSKS
jgi:hypothetical protein